jgi:type II secretory pathway pseudopilin PulG
MRTFKGQKGLSLVEVTIMLLVLMLLTSVLAPSIFDFIKDAERVKVKEDCEAIGLSIARLVRDVGNCLTVAAGACTLTNRADLLYSDGTPASDTSNSVTLGATISNIVNPTWALVVAGTTDDSLANQLVSNNPGYATPVTNLWGNMSNPLPLFRTGWRGAYLSPPIGPDPWGHQYYVNSEFLSVATTSATGTGEGQQSGGWSYDTFCISAGENGIITTSFGAATGFGTNRGGDDFIYVISGGTR